MSVKQQGQQGVRCGASDEPDGRGGTAKDERCDSGARSSIERITMNVVDLIKATVACGVSAFLTYSFPVIGQIVIIGLLSLLWLAYAHKTFSAIRRK